jgi:regulator of RNase E activity RraA
MDNTLLHDAFSDLSTPFIADACERLRVPLRAAPASLQSLIGGSRIAGRVLPTQHFGSVDIFLEAMEHADPGDILVIDNSARMDEGCIGDLTVLESRACGLGGIVLWGCHRDTSALLEIGFPVFSLGRFPVGPVRLDPRDDMALESARIGSCDVSRDDCVFADDDGALFVATKHCEAIIDTARAIRETECRQTAAIAAGKTLRDQFAFAEYLSRRASDPTYTFRRHLRRIGGAMEE